MQNFSPKNERYKLHIRSSSSGVLNQVDKPPEHLALKVSRAYFQESQRAERNSDSTLKRYTQNLTHSRTR